MLLEAFGSILTLADFGTDAVSSCSLPGVGLKDHFQVLKVVCELQQPVLSPQLSTAPWTQPSSGCRTLIHTYSKSLPEGRRSAMWLGLLAAWKPGNGHTTK